MARAKSVVLWEGASLIDGSPVVAIVTGLARPSANEKTGPMAQVWILRADVSPLDALATGGDRGICGDCPHRPDGWGSCYVNVGRAPSMVWGAYQRGVYPHAADIDLAHELRGRRVRFGAYGDPAAVPLDVWETLADIAQQWTGYTHQWRSRPDLAPYVMASVDSEAEAREAQALGWRTFRVRQAGQELLETECQCPASDEAGKLTTCDRCQLCQGTSKDAKSVAIVVHGSSAGGFRIGGSVDSGHPQTTSASGRAA